MADAVNGGNMMKAGEIISGVGDKIVELGNHAKDTALEFQSSFGTIAANTNLSKAEMESLKGVAVDVFKSGVTDSIDEATQATILMKSAFKDLNNEDLSKITEQVIALSKRTNTEYTDNIKAADYLMKAFGVSNKEAFDMIASGYKNGLNASGDFTDTIVEYSGTVKEAGYTQEEFFSMLNSGLKNGVRNTDLIADSMVEFGKKLAAGDYEEMIGGMSAETQNMFNEYKNGNATVGDVMSSVQEEMKKMSPAQQQEALTKLGSQFEDLGIKGFLGLSTVGNEFKNVEGATTNDIRIIVENVADLDAKDAETVVTELNKTITLINQKYDELNSRVDIYEDDIVNVEEWLLGKKTEIENIIESANSTFNQKLSEIQAKLDATNQAINNGDFYSKTETDQKLSAINTTITNHTSNKTNPHAVTASQVGSYTKAETNAFLGQKADDSGVVHKAGDETINGKKTFDAISVNKIEVPIAQTTIDLGWGMSAKIIKSGNYVFINVTTTPTSNVGATGGAAIGIKVPEGFRPLTNTEGVIRLQGNNNQLGSVLVSDDGNCRLISGGMNTGYIFHASGSWVAA